MFVRALDACGDTWASPINVSSFYISGINTESDPTLFIVDGHPAVSFHDSSNSDFIYCRADDVDGINWTQFKIIKSGSKVGFHSKMAITNGNPSIIYTTQSTTNGNCNGSVKIVRANDIQGNNWNTPIQIVGGQCNYWSTNNIFYEILNGNPSVAFQLNSNSGPGDPSGPYFVRANDINGNSWPTPQNVFDGRLLQRPYYSG